MTDQRLELRIGASVHASDGLVGHVHRVILNPGQHRVVGLVVHGLQLPPRDWLVPIELVEDINEEQVELRARRDEILMQPPFDPAHFLPAYAEEQGSQLGEALVSLYGGSGGLTEIAHTAAHQRDEAKITRTAIAEGHPIALQSGQKVQATDGPAGRVDLLLIDPNYQVSHFVIRKGGLLRRDVIVPVEWISRIDHRGVWLAMERQDLNQLPPYRPDSAIAYDVDQALWKDEVIRSIDLDTTDVTVRDGVVVLSGYTSTPTNKQRAESAARQVPGVLKVENRIASDDEVVTAVADALGRDPRTRQQGIYVRSDHGIVVLTGEVGNAEVRAAAEEVAATVPVVRGVENYISAPGTPVDERQQRVLQPRIGQNVYAKDVYLGRVERVIINPHNKRVTAFVVHGNFPDLELAKPWERISDMPQKERHVTMPITAVDNLTISAVWLTIDSLAAARNPDFKPEDFVGPDAGWVPPYPYTSTDVLLEPSKIATEEAVISSRGTK